MPHPLRFQRKRAKGWRMPPGGLCCTRPGPWGNPFVTAEEFRESLLYFLSGPRDRKTYLVDDLMHMRRIAGNIHELRGRPLVCFCGLDQPCHVDVLCEIANRKEHDQP